MNIDNKKIEASINFNIKTYEIDIAGHVNNIVYVKWLEDLRCKLFEQIFPIESLLKENLYPVVISTNIIYKNQLKISDKPVGKIWIDGVSHNIMKLKIEYMINDKKCAIAEQRCILMNLKNIMMDKSKFKILYSETGDL